LQGFFGEEGLMQPLTLEQLRATTLKAEGNSFVISIITQTGKHGLLITTRAKEPRRFADPRKAMLLLREMGIATARIDTSRWKPSEGRIGTPRPDRAHAMKRAHEAAAHDRWFRSQVEDGLRESSDPAAIVVPHEQVMRQMKTTIDRIAAKNRTASSKSRRRAR
jgi:hypothetical protein